MSVASRSTARRWAAALALSLAVVLAPSVAARLPAGSGDPDIGRLLAAVRGSSSVAHQGLVEATGTLGLPDLPRLGDVAALLGGTTRARVWWQSPKAWRVDRITTTGESGVYAIPGGVQTWDFESGDVEQAVGMSPVRLPRVDDLLPPQATRRALAGVTSRDLVTALPPRRVAGREAEGVRVVPADRTSTVGKLDVYADRETGLPLSLVVVPRGSDVAALQTAFLDVSFEAPLAGDMLPRTPPFTRIRSTETPDLATAVDRYAPFALPARLAGTPRTRDLVGSGGGTATYGEGLARFVVLPLPSRLGRPALDAAAGGGGTDLDVGTGGQAVLIATPLLNAVVTHAEPVPGHHRSGPRGRWYLLAGTVDDATLQAAVRDLLADPPGLR